LRNQDVVAALDITSGKMTSRGRIGLPARRTSMRRTKEILRLRFESGLGLRQIARSLSISVGTVQDYLQRTEAAGIKWPLPEGWGDSQVEAALFRQPTAAVPPRKVPPDYAAIHQQVQKPHWIALSITLIASKRAGIPCGRAGAS
jgi:DNA-binding CsgD family transcriptional regulator